MVSVMNLPVFVSFFSRIGSVVCFVVLACLALMPSARAQQTPTEVYGPWNVVVLTDGPGLSEPMPGAYGGPPSAAPFPAELIAAHAQWTISFWFRSTDTLSTDGTMLLAGFGDPAAKDARFIGLKGNRLALWLGTGSGKFIASDTPLSSAEWHFAAAVCEGDKVTLYADSKAVTSSSLMQDAVAAHLVIAPSQTSGVGTLHFGGKIAFLKLYSQPLTAAQIDNFAANPPDFGLPQYTEASLHWSVSTRGMLGQTQPQDPMTLPHGKGGFQKPVPKPQSAADLHTELIGDNPWTLHGGWKLAAAPDVKTAGEEISRVGFGADSWLTATVPGTVLTTMIDRGIYPDPDYGLNNLAIPESLAHQDYWYRVEFKSPAVSQGEHITLTFEGVNYASEVWLNGNKLGGFTGAFLRGKFDVTSLLAANGANALAVRVSPPPHPGLAQEESIKAGPGENGGMEMLDGPTFGAAEGWDWIPSIRDRNTGIWQDVTLTRSGAVEVGDLNVITTLPKSDRSEADIEIEVPLVDISKSGVEGELTASFDDVTVTKHLQIGPGETVVRLKPDEFPQLKVQHPRLWWPNGYGESALHALTVRFTAEGKVSSQQQIDFGMREVSYELSLMDATGHLRRVEVLPSRTHDEAAPLINESNQGIRSIDDKTPNLLKPGQPSPEWMRQAWVHSLAPGAEATPSIRPADGDWPGTDLVIKVNRVRIAARGGNWGMDDSRKRVSVERLEPYFRLHRDAHVNIIRNWMGQNTEENFYALADKYGLMVWNDFWESTQNYNIEAQNPELFLGNARDSILHFRHHPSIVLWCGRNEGVPQPIINDGLATLVRTLDHTRYYTGSSNRVNLRNSGPYQLQTLDTYYNINRGFSVELGIPSVPTLEGLKAFIPEPDRWPISDTWAYHDWHQLGNGAVKPFMQTMEKDFGAPTSLEDFERKAQVIDYAAHRAIFEGFAAHLWQPNSARLIWMTQPAWPSTEWNFLGSDYDTQSSFYGSQKACEPIHAQLNLTDSSVDLINLHEARTFKVRVHVVGVDGKTLSDETASVQASADARTPVSKPDLEKLAAGHAIFVQLQVSSADGAPISDNFYWWSKDETALRELGSLPEAILSTTATLSNAESERKAVVRIKNSGSAPALLVKLTLKDASTGERILPAYYSENYVSLLPGEERTISIEFPRGVVKPAIGLRGWNLQTSIVAVQ
jgi:hypothetical protein